MKLNLAATKYRVAHQLRSFPVKSLYGFPYILLSLIGVLLTQGELSATCTLSSRADYVTGVFPLSVVYSPDGLYCAVANWGIKSEPPLPGSLSVYKIGDGGTLMPVPGSPVPTGSSNPISLAFSPDGLYLAVTSNISMTVSVFALTNCSTASS